MESRRCKGIHSLRTTRSVHGGATAPVSNYLLSFLLTKISNSFTLVLCATAAGRVVLLATGDDVHCIVVLLTGFASLDQRGRAPG